MSGGRYGDGEWQAVPCVVADAIRHNPNVFVTSGYSDIAGRFGKPEVYTEWGLTESTPVLREHRWPDERAADAPRGVLDYPDVAPCEHYVPPPSPGVSGTASADEGSPT